MEESVSENEEIPEITPPSGGEQRERTPDIPDELAILPLFNTVIYPLTVIPLAVGQEQSIRLIDEGNYGYCEETGEPIGIPRLLARPTATLSLEAQERRERVQKLYGD